MKIDTSNIPMSSDELEQWAFSRDTSEHVAEAIIHACGGDMDAADGVWENGPENSNRCALIMDRAVKNSGEAPEDLFWGENTLADLARQYGI